MNIETAIAAFARYAGNLVSVSTKIHPDDHMFNSAANGMKDYMFVGQSGVRVLLNVAQVCGLTSFSSILDFGCGHGRVARHLRVCWPEAKLAFCDIDESCWSFCAEEFRGTGFPSTVDFGALDIPGSYDLIWLGSVFTHTDWAQSKCLMEKLCSALKPGGAIVATFHGRQVYEGFKADPTRSGLREASGLLLEQFEAHGFGYGEYPFMKDWGVNLIDFAHMQKLAPAGDVYMAAAIDRAWANYHDIGVWRRRA